MDKKEFHRLSTILAYLHFHPGDEGIGGLQAWRHAGHWRVGTRLRAPWGPLYMMGPKEREARLNHLVNTGCLEVYGEEDDKKLYRTTKKGLDFLKKLPLRLIDYVFTYKGPQATFVDLKYAFTDPEKFQEKIARIPPGCNISYDLKKIYEY